MCPYNARLKKLQERIAARTERYLLDTAASFARTIGFPAQMPKLVIPQYPERPPSYTWRSDCATFHPVTEDCKLKRNECQELPTSQ